MEQISPNDDDDEDDIAPLFGAQTLQNSACSCPFVFIRLVAAVAVTSAAIPNENWLSRCTQNKNIGTPTTV
jgi:hypothetical protein